MIILSKDKKKFLYKQKKTNDQLSPRSNLKSHTSSYIDLNNQEGLLRLHSIKYSNKKQNLSQIVSAKQISMDMSIIESPK